MDLFEIIDNLKPYSDPKRLASMKRAGIFTQNALGISVKHIRALAKNIQKTMNWPLRYGIQKSMKEGCWLA